MSDGLLTTVSMRNALPSFRYCLTRLCLKVKSIFTSVPGLKTLVCDGSEVLTPRLVGTTRPSPLRAGRRRHCQ